MDNAKQRNRIGEEPADSVVTIIVGSFVEMNSYDLTQSEGYAVYAAFAVGRCSWMWSITSCDIATTTNCGSVNGTYNRCAKRATTETNSGLT